MDDILGNSSGLLTAEQKAAGYDVNTLYPDMAAQEVAATSGARAGTLTNLNRMGGGYEAALGAIAPGWQSALSELSGEAGVAASGTPDALLGQMNSEAIGAAPTALTNQLAATTGQQLALGAGLSTQQTQQAQQAAAAGAQARGMADSNGALASEILNTDQAGQALLSTREQAAGAADSQVMQNQQMNQGFQSGTESENQALQANNRNFLTTDAQVQQNALAPVTGFFGASTQTPVSPTAPASVMSSAQGTYNPMLSYGGNLFDWNSNANAATLLNNANNNAALIGAGIGAIGSLAGGAAKACWVAREVLGRNNYKWAVFRQWLMDDAPVWFFNLYWAFGRQFAEWIHDKPRVKGWLRPWFEKRARAKWEAVDEEDLAEIWRVLVEYEQDMGVRIYTGGNSKFEIRNSKQESTEEGTNDGV